MATATVLATPALPKATFKPIIQNQNGKRKLQNVSFDPREHLTYEQPEGVIMMKDIGYSEDTGVSPVAVSQPFRLFSTECIQKFRDEVLSDQVMKDCLYKSNLAACQIRGYATKYAPFIYDAWHNPETLATISKIAGVDLIPNINFEVGHVNISVKSEKQASEERAAVERERKSYAEDEGIAGCPWEDDKPVVGWHTDSYPFVCVTMLSDCTNMVGGETALRTADGDVMKVRGPQMGCAVVMQGRYITHQALRALGAQERITMVTSFRPKSPFLADDSVLTTVRGISDLSELYYEYGRYRLEMLEERIRVQLKHLREAHTAGKKTYTKAIKLFLEEQERFIHRTNEELVPDEDVVAGRQPELDIPNEKTPSPPVDVERSSKRVKVA
ncbi:hypothetical protein LTR85_004042 [Meristemomyces frigidus]|nr:hypothetical protein LTR85_004042 [Meristemomyces frigidus]